MPQEAAIEFACRRTASGRSREDGGELGSPSSLGRSRHWNNRESDAHVQRNHDDIVLTTLPRA